MAIPVPTAASSRAPMGSARKTALVAGSFHLITFAASIPAIGPGSDQYWATPPETGMDQS
jgi:hypothetical protein